jgi:hypothetical protein
VLTTRPGFDVEQIVEVVRREKVALRGLERQDTSDGGRVVLVVKLPPRYRTEQLLDALGRWRACTRSSGSTSQRRPRRSGRSAGSQVRPTRNGPKRP